jgi:hypothetical protein
MSVMTTAASAFGAVSQIEAGVLDVGHGSVSGAHAVRAARAWPLSGVT